MTMGNDSLAAHWSIMLTALLINKIMLKVTISLIVSNFFLLLARIKILSSGRQVASDIENWRRMS